MELVAVKRCTGWLSHPRQVTDADNALAFPQPIPGYGSPSDVNTYAIMKEVGGTAGSTRVPLPVNRRAG